MVKHQLWLKTLDHVINNRVAPWATTKFKIQNDSMASLEFDDAFWVNHIPDLRKAQPMTRIHLVLSLICFLKVSVLQLLTFTFESDIKAVKDKASIFMGYSPNAGPREIDRFPPARMMNIWSIRWPNVCRKHFKAMIGPYASEIAKRESDCLISNPKLRISLEDLTADRVQDILKPELLAGTYREQAPFVFDILHTFASAPNPYRKKKAKSTKSNKVTMEVDPESLESNMDESDGENDLLTEDGFPLGASSDWKKEYPGFSRNPLLVGDYLTLKCNGPYQHFRPLFYASVC
jgi:hypothetical protein